MAEPKDKKSQKTIISVGRLRAVSVDADVVEEVRALAAKETRNVSNMVQVLVAEALAARKFTIKEQD